MYRIIQTLMIIFNLGMTIKSFNDYNEYSNIKNNIPIDYKYESKSMSGGRSAAYNMVISYNGKNENVSITRKEYIMLDEEIYPKLYYSNKSKTIYSNWIIKQSYRSIFVFIFMLIIVIIPWDIIYNSGLKKNKIKNN